MFFRDWFVLKPLSAGDWAFWYPEALKNFSWWPVFRAGAYPGLDFYYQITAKFFASLGLNWPIIERIVWFWPFLIITPFSCHYLIKSLFKKNQLILTFFSWLVYGFNTYILMVVDGGQMGIALAYSLIPLILSLFIDQKLSVAGLILGLQIMFDLRITLITVLAVVIFAVFIDHSLIKKYFKSFLLAFLFNFFWLIPSLVSRKTALPVGYEQAGWVSFLSLADFSKTFSLLHPNWPENIFGKTYLMQPEFLVLPILAYLSLLFANFKRNILFFALLGLGGAFLAKGANPPFGEVYIWLFKYIPGMKLFRDPSKFYLLVALSYSVLIPVTILEIYKWLKTKPELFGKLYLFLSVAYLLVLIKPAIIGQLKGTFRAKDVPQDYLVLMDFLYPQGKMATFWVPRHQRFGYHSLIQPALSVADYVEDNKCLEPFCKLKISSLNREYFACHKNEKCYSADASFLANQNSKAELKKLGVKYLIIPYDSEGEIFFYERKYDAEARQKLEQFLDSIPWFNKVSVTEKIAVYKLTN